MIDRGTKCKLGPLCGLARGNPQWPLVINLISESKISQFNFLVDLKTQSAHCDKQCTVRMFTKILRLKKWLNMNSKPDNKCARGGDII